ncbi:MAG: DoxX family protein [Patescibacteria group bacterium]
MISLNNIRIKLKPYIPLILRLSLGFIFLWSGLSKFGADSNALGVCTNASEAVSLVSSFTWLPMEPELFVFYQSIGEIILGSMLILGLATEIAALFTVLAFIIFFIILDFSLVWKNVGLLAAALTLWSLELDNFRAELYLVKFLSRPKS